jgi:hypothetical protein
MRSRILVTVVAVLCLAGLALKVRANFTPPGRTVQVAVQAIDPSPGATLHYQWRSTDGKLTSVDAPSVSWTLPPGPGLHFAYVLVSNTVGGYTEKRIAVNTDSFGNNSIPLTAALPYVAPPAPAASGNTYRSAVGWGQTFVNGFNHDVHIPDASVYIVDNNTGTTYPPSGSVKSDLRGEFVISNVPPGDNYDVLCQPPNAAAFTYCNGGFFFGPITMPDIATSDYLSSYPSTDNDNGIISGNLVLQDGSTCGTFNEFFGVHSTGTATSYDTAGNVLAGPVRLNEVGDFSLVWSYANPPASITLACEGAPALAVTVTPDDLNQDDVGTVTLTDISAPVVQSMTATLNGTVISSVDFTIPSPSLPSDIVTRADNFLAEKGLDTRMGACQYYKAIGAAKDCDPNGNLISPITFTDWKRAVKIGPYAVNFTPTFLAAYINKVDLNLARVHSSITYGPNNTAAVVCNHLGPPDFFNSPQAEVDTAVSNAVQNKNLVACVAMDYKVSSGVNNNQPFVRFLIFGPSGQLLPSINLDGRREKFVPGTCVVCHGGDHYAGKFPEDGSGSANVGGHFLPYDVGNFEFSSKLGLRDQDQEQSIYHLNRNILNAGPTQAERDLVNGWYANEGFRKTLKTAYIDPSWPSSGAPYNFYQHVYARSCRTCHVALTEGYNFDHYQNITPGGSFYRADRPEVDVRISVCGGDQQYFRDHTMANSLVTFNRFWLSADPAANTTGEPNQPDDLTQFLLTPDGQGPCLAGQAP